MTTGPETTPVPEPMQRASLEDLVAALGPTRPGGAPAIEITEDDEVEPDPALAGIELADELPIDVDDDLSKVQGQASPRLCSIVESLLFAATGPLTVKNLRRLLKDPSKEQIQLALKHLSVELGQRGVVLHQVAGGFRLRTNPENAQFVQRLIAGRPVRLSRSQLEALAVIAYRQPVTKAEVDHVRGVDCSAVLRLLLERDLIKIVGRKEEPGRPHMYGTTVTFLELFNLKNLRDMPDLHEFRELSEESEAMVRETLGPEAALAEEQEALGQEAIDFDADAAEAAHSGVPPVQADAEVVAPEGEGEGDDGEAQAADGNGEAAEGEAAEGDDDEAAAADDEAAAADDEAAAEDDEAAAADDEPAAAGDEPSEGEAADDDAEGAEPEQDASDSSADPRGDEAQPEAPADPGPDVE